MPDLSPRRDVDLVALDEALGELVRVDLQRRVYGRFRRPLDRPRERKPFSIAQDPTQLPIAEALRRARLQRQGRPWEPRPRSLREEYTPPEPEPDPEE